MNKHWEKATAQQKAWGDKHAFWAKKPKVPDKCDGCDLHLFECQRDEPCLGNATRPSIIFKQKREAENDNA